MKDMPESFTYHIAISIVPHWECQTSTGVGALAMDGIGSSACHAWRPISPSLNFCNFSFKRKVNEYRMYDPVMSSFLSVDRYVQNPSNSQNFNRYSYCLNNPLRFTDPSGWQYTYKPIRKIDWLSRPTTLHDFWEGSPFMVNYYLNGVDCSGGIGGIGGGGGSSYCPYLPDGINLASNNCVSMHPNMVWDLGSLLRNYMNDPSLFNRRELIAAGVAGFDYGYWHTGSGDGGYYMNIQYTNGNSSGISCDNYNYGHMGYSDVTIGASNFYYEGIGINNFAGLWASISGLTMSSISDEAVIKNPKNFNYYENLGQLHKTDYIKKGIVAKGASRQAVGREVAKKIGRTSNLLSVTGLALSISEPVMQGELKGSDIYYIGSSGVCAALTLCEVSGPVGWIVGGCLIAGELISYGFTGQSVGDNINEWCNNWSWKFR